MELIDIQIGNPNYLWLLTVVVTCLLVTVYAILARHRSARKFTTTSSPKKISRSTAKHWVSSSLITASLTLLTIGLMDIRWGKTTREVPQKGIEVMFVLDVSRSMLAQDASPNRLSRAKQQIKDMIDEMGGDRVGLLVFAGETRQSVPLTSHYEDFKQTLDMVGTQSVRVGGSRLGDAITAAANGFISKTNDHKAIVIFTDGEDQESEPVEIAKTLFTEQGIRIFTVGLGDMDQGARIPNQDTRGQNFVEYEGQQVWSKMNGQILKAIATETNGAYIPAGTKRVDMANVYHGYLANVEKAEFETAKIDAYIPRFQWFAVPALCLLALEVLISTKRKRKHQTPVVDLVKDPYSQKRVVDLVKDPISQNEGSLTRSTTKQRPSKQPAQVAALTTALLLLPFTADALANENTFAKQLNTANQELRAGNYDAAIEQYQQLVRTPQQQSLIDYNLAVAYYRNGDLQAAQNLFNETAISANNQIAADSRYNLGNCQYALALEQSEQNAKNAISMLQDAIINYRSSLRIDADNPDARANIELAVELLKRLEQQEQERENQQNQDQQNQSSENQEQEQSQQQKQEDNEQNQSPDNSDSPPDSQDQPQENSEQQSQEQSQGNDSEPSQQQQDNSQSQSESDSRKDQRNDGQNQQQADSDDQSNDVEGQEQTEKNQDQPVPSGQLSTADQDEPEQLESGSSVVQQNPDQGLMTKEEALKMLQAVRDRDMLRRLRQERQERARQVPVEKDW